MKIIWNGHACFPLLPSAGLSALQFYHEAGIDFVAINVGMDFMITADMPQILDYFRHWIQQHH